jgi:hypothetical protein
MKTLGRLGSTLVAVASMALMGASPAPANDDTILCADHEEPCATPNQVSHLHMRAANARWLQQFVVPVTLTCESISALAAILELARPQVGHLQSFIWSGCETTSGEDCNFESIRLGLVLVLRTGLNLGTFQLHGTEVHIDCGAVVSCTYGGLPALEFEGALHNPGFSNGVVRANGLEIEQTGGILCPPTTQWHAAFEPLEELYIVL